MVLKMNKIIATLILLITSNILLGCDGTNQPPELTVKSTSLINDRSKQNTSTLEDLIIDDGRGTVNNQDTEKPQN